MLTPPSVIVITEFASSFLTLKVRLTILLLFLLLEVESLTVTEVVPAAAV